MLVPDNGNSSLQISVVIPTYNRLSSLPRAIESVVAQTHPIHQIIVVNDGSIDDTEHWLAQCKHPLTVIQQNNHGVSHARNRAIEQATGDWIALLDSDDYWYKNKLDVQAQAILNSKDYRLCHCDEHWIRNDKRVNQKHKHKKQGGDIFEHCLRLCAISPSASIIHRTVFDDIGLFDESLPACEDYDLWLRLTCKEPVLYVDEPLLVKTGGHDDQLSQRFPAMDRFRLQALAKLIRSNSLSDEQQLSTLKIFRKKFSIYTNGARKRNHEERAQQAEELFADILSMQPLKPPVK